MVVAHGRRKYHANNQIAASQLVIGHNSASWASIRMDRVPAEALSFELMQFFTFRGPQPGSGRSLLCAQANRCRACSRLGNSSAIALSAQSKQTRSSRDAAGATLVEYGQANKPMGAKLKLSGEEAGSATCEKTPGRPINASASLLLEIRHF